jgi:transposase
MSDLFGVGGQQLLAGAELSPAAQARVNSALRLIETLDFEIDVFAKLAVGRLRAHGGYQAIQQIPGVGPVLAAVFVAEIADITLWVPRTMPRPLTGAFTAG